MNKNWNKLRQIVEKEELGKLQSMGLQKSHFMTE